MVSRAHPFRLPRRPVERHVRVVLAAEGPELRDRAAAWLLACRGIRLVAELDDLRDLACVGFRLPCDVLVAACAASSKAWLELAAPRGPAPIVPLIVITEPPNAWDGEDSPSAATGAAWTLDADPADLNSLVRGARRRRPAPQPYHAGVPGSA